MRWSNIRTIFLREIRDQLRDRRTIFMVFVFPVLLYPLLGLGLAQLATAFQAKARRVVVVGADSLPERQWRAIASATQVGAPQALAPLASAPVPLLTPDGHAFDPDLFDSPGDASLLEVECVPAAPPWTDPAQRRVLLREGRADAVVLVPHGLAASIGSMDRTEIPIAYNGASEHSQLTEQRVARVIERWKQRMVETRRTREGKPEGYSEPVRTEAQDVATRAEAGNSTWAKIFPFLLVLMSLTGAFYPAVDLCAGEKERGTMETVLISPASRTEIVMGKFLTIMAASMATALLNLVSMGLTGLALAAQTGRLPSVAFRPGGSAAALTPPSPESLVWIALLLMPLAAFFSALCLALAVLARSMKEGQYYMTPLYLLALPLVIYSIMPGVELTLFTSLLPITGVSLLLKTLMQGDYDTARRYFLPVFLPVVLCGLLALRWAIDQFKSESVLFRESERFDLAAWLRHVLTHKPARPSPAQALLCFVLMLVVAFFVSLILGMTLHTLLAMHLGSILGIPVLMCVLLTSDPRGTLRLRWPRFRYLILGVVLPVALFPLVSELRVWVEWLFPTPDVAKHATAALQDLLTSAWVAWLVLAALPAISEEVAFRGFILSGLEHAYRPTWAIALSALLFGFMHVLLSLFTQLFNATLLGLILGLLAIKSRSLLPGIVFHLTNNTLGLFIGNLASSPSYERIATVLFLDPAKAVFRPAWVFVGTIISAVLIVLLVRETGDRKTAPAPEEHGAPIRPVKAATWGRSGGVP
jgi:sodium transport system permease protein